MPRLLLEYPNGRIHNVSYEGALPEVGAAFELYGRRWRVVAHQRPRNAPKGVEPVLLCRPLTASPLSRYG